MNEPGSDHKATASADSLQIQQSPSHGPLQQPVVASSTSVANNTSLSANNSSMDASNNLSMQASSGPSVQHHVPQQQQHIQVSMPSSSTVTMSAPMTSGSIPIFSQSQISVQPQLQHTSVSHILQPGQGQSIQTHGAQMAAHAALGQHLNLMPQAIQQQPIQVIQQQLGNHGGYQIQPMYQQNHQPMFLGGNGLPLTIQNLAAFQNNGSFLLPHNMNNAMTMGNVNKIPIVSKGMTLGQGFNQANIISGIKPGQGMAHNAQMIKHQVLQQPYGQQGAQTVVIGNFQQFQQHQPIQPANKMIDQKGKSTFVSFADLMYLFRSFLLIVNCIMLFVDDST